MNQDSSFPPMLPPSTELGALLFAILPCLRETYRPLASFAYHMTELTRLKTIPTVPPLTGLSDIDALITDKDSMLRSLSFYGKLFRMPLLNTVATLLQGWQFYQAYKDILPMLFSGMGSSNGFGGTTSDTSGTNSFDLFSMLGGLSPDLLSSLFSGFSGSSTSYNSEPSPPSPEPPDSVTPPPTSTNTPFEPIPPSDNSSDSTFSSADTATESSSPDDTLYNTLYSFLTPEQQKIYEQLMHTE